ncbi:MAG TPA: hypothetical protein VE422_10060 [Terriglobia bacterium]|nr:hypothetical protein [Terriglobia bacterium]
MKILTAAVMLFFVTQQRLPRELQVPQIEDPRVRNAGILILGGENPVITNSPQQLPATQLEQNQQVQLGSQPFDVLFRDADLRLALTGLAQAHGLNLVMGPEISGTLTIDLRGVTLLQALDAILPPRNLSYTIVDGMLRVTRILPENRQFSFDYITTQRTLSRSLSATSSAGGGGAFGGTFAGAVGGTAGGMSTGFGASGGGGGGSSSSLSGAESTNLLQDVQTGLDALKSADGKIIYNRMAGIIFVTDYPVNLDAIGSFLESVQNAVHRQVVIEAKIVEVKLNDDSQVGVNWTAVLGNTLRIEQPLSVAGGSISVGATFRDFNATLTALANQGKVDVLSSPTVSTLNNQPAIIRVGTQDVFFTTTVQVDPRTGTIVQTATVPSTINEGIVLDVTPQISADGIIMMNIHPTVTERTGQATSPQGATVPIVDVRETDTVVRLRQGETVFIGGLISDRKLVTINKVPVLGDVPVFGNLFRRTVKENKKTDLVILLTPRVLDIRSSVDYTRGRMEDQDRLRQEKK